MLFCLASALYADDEILLNILPASTSPRGWPISPPITQYCSHPLRVGGFQLHPLLTRAESGPRLFFHDEEAPTISCEPYPNLICIHGFACLTVGQEVILGDGSGGGGGGDGGCGGVVMFLVVVVVVVVVLVLCFLLVLVLMSLL